MRMGIKHRIGNGNGREWETTSVGIGTCTPMGIYSQRFYAAMSLSRLVRQYKLLYKPLAKVMGRAIFDHPQRRNHWTDFNKT